LVHSLTLYIGKGEQSSHAVPASAGPHYDVQGDYDMATSIMELLQERAAVVEQMKKLLDTADDEKRDLRRDEKAEYDKMDARIDVINSLVEKKQKVQGLTLNFGEKGKVINPLGAGVETKTHTGMGNDFQSIFGGPPHEPLKDDGWGSFGEFLGAIANNRSDPRLKEYRDMLAGSGPSGGYTVPEAWSQSILAPQDATDLRKYSTVRGFEEPGDVFNVPVWNFADMSAGQRYKGLNVSWTGEAMTLSDSTPAIKSLRMEPHKLYCYVKASRELLADSMDIERELGQAMIQALTWEINKVIIAGTGVGRPLGFTVAASTASVSRGAPNTISFADLRGMWGKMAPWHLQGPGVVWVCHPQAVEQLMAMQDAGAHYLWIPNGAADLPSTLFGKPLILKEQCPGLGEAGDITLIDLRATIVLEKLQVTVESSPHLLFDKDEVAFRCVARIDAASIYSDPIILPDGKYYGAAVKLV
jgi:HK97 family phage major capsid protein